MDFKFKKMVYNTKSLPLTHQRPISILNPSTQIRNKYCLFYILFILNYLRGEKEKNGFW